jgi:hypothetical protein
MHQLEDLIFKALNTGNDNIKRSEAEAGIFSLLLSNPSQFFYFAAEIVANSSNAQILRQSTCSVIKTLLIRRVIHRLLRMKTDVFIGIGRQSMLKIR